MKRRIWAGALLIAAIAPWSVAQANGVAVSVSTPGFGFQIGAPFYGPPVYGPPVYSVPVYIPPPRVIVPAPVFVPAPVYAPAPVYFPPRHVYAPRIVYTPRPVFYPRSHRQDVRSVNWQGQHWNGNPNSGRGHGRDD